MHHALQILEIRSLICSFVETDSTLARLARTCQAFQEPALAELWRCQADLSSLITVMPDDLWKMKYKGSDPFHEVSFTRDIQQDDWSRFDHYMPKIKVFCVTDAYHVTSDILATLIFHKERKNIFSNLKTMRILRFPSVLNDHRFFPLFQLTLNPSIQHLLIDDLSQLGATRQFLPSFYKIFGAQCSNVLTLKAPAYIGSKEIPFSFPSWLSRFQQLQTAEVEIFPEHAKEELVQGLGRLSVVKKLSICAITQPRNWVLDTSGFKPNTFTKLVDLDLQYIPLQDILNILQILSGPLTRLYLRPIGKLEAIHRLVRLTELIARFTDLEYLFLLGFVPESQRPNRVSFPPEAANATLSTLFRLRKITQFESSFLVDKTENAWLRQIPDEWPQLQSLTLCPSHISAPVTTRMTLEGLIPIAAHSRRLIRLEVALIVRPFSPTSLPDGFAGSHSVRHIRFVKYSTLESFREALQYILRLFPRLETAKGFASLWAGPALQAEFDNFNKLLKRAINL